MMLISAALLALASTAASAPSPRLKATPTKLELSNGFVRAVFDLQRASLDTLQGRLEGDGAFADPDATNNNVAPRVPGGVPSLPIGTQQGALAVIVTGNGAGVEETATSTFIRASPLAYTVLQNSTQGVSVAIAGITDHPTSPRINATFVFSLAANSRSLLFNVSASSVSSFNTTLIRVSTSWAPPGVVGMYSAGVRQGMFMEQPFIASAQPWDRFYALGANLGAIDISPLNAAAKNPSQTILFGGTFNGRQSGIDIVLAGSVPNDNWLDGFESNPPHSIAVGGNTVWAPVALAITPNNYDFPSSLVSTTAPTMAVNDLRAVLTAVYGSPMSALHSLDYAPESRIAPCLNLRGGVCYGGLYNFFDPDSFLSTSAMLYSFDAAVHDEVRRLLETNALYFCPATAPSNRCEYGQMIHHFVPSCSPGDPACVCQPNKWNPSINDCVVYQAISGAVQTGPNIFWTMSALRYASIAVNGSAWLQAYIPQIRTSMQFLLNRFDSNVGLFNVPGSLQIDTFIRQNYTSDTNAGILLLFELMAEAEQFLGNSTGASFYTSIGATVRQAMNKYLMAPSGDHYCTNSDPVPGQPGKVNICTRDFVDYDSNLLAIAAGVATGAQAQTILNRIDGGACTHPRGTYVSEIYYDGANCVGGNIGDSDITMGRIAWADARARHAMGDAANAAIFNDVILAPLQYDLLANTWMYERYTCQGTPTHNAYYIEMPEVVAMMLFEVKYGIQLGLMNVTVAPIFGNDDFDWALGAWSIGYHNNNLFTASLPYAGTRTFTVTRMTPGTYNVATQTASGKELASSTVVVGADGVLQFQSSVGSGSTITAQLA